VSDGTFAPRELLSFSKIRWPKKLIVDVHVMSTHPHAEVAIALEKKPNLLVVHSESQVDFLDAAKKLNLSGVKAGIAIMPETDVSKVKDYIHAYDHALIFSGNLGYQGGSTANLKLLSKVIELKILNPRLEIGWDGGVKDDNIFELVTHGVDVINVGGFIQHSRSPKKAYAKLELALTKPKLYAD
jgi:ribulose-phosphate 3-epimerase